MSILTLKNISYHYSGSKKRVLKNISMEFEPGKVYVIMGKSGAGKSTILSLVSGLDVCTEGKIEYAGTDMKSIDRDQYRSKNIGVIFQGYNLLTNATALENIVLSMNISGSKEKDKKKYAYDLLERVGIDKETADRKVLKLSGGEQQRIGIARAISHNPDIIIADEPTGNLDNDTEKNIMEILCALAHKENKCVIAVTHSKDVSKYADEVWGLNSGSMVFVK
ncbi:MAG: ABC transporter ATP-binding protein [Candidatus Izemoplasmatales bacterium]|nr:ABC transporter ATP-binding protein [Candidatus Izemoplasmatales bacterium]MDD3865110.1 ABC transporter ATP-binding protein [Candidatus Izemoplasmatales bacterium]